MPDFQLILVYISRSAGDHVSVGSTTNRRLKKKKKERKPHLLLILLKSHFGSKRLVVFGGKKRPSPKLNLTQTESRSPPRERVGEEKF